MEMTKAKLWDMQTVVDALAKDVSAAGSQAQWCVKNRISTAYINDVLKGRRDPGQKILDALGFEAVTLYRKKS
jgi:hypothetical protein